jgi:hypothetical protein
MELNERSIIKYFDIILLADKKDSFFSINKILIPEYFKYETSENRDFLQDIRRELKEFSEFHGYFEWFADGSCRLTEKGLDAEEKGGHLKHKKSLTKKPLDWYKIIAIILAVIFGSFNLYQKYDYNNLKTQYNSLRTINENMVNNILLKNSVYKVFSNPNKKDKFTILIIGESIIEGEMVFKIIDFEGAEILNETYPSNVLISGYIFDEKSTSKKLEEYIKKRVSEFFKEDNFSNPALSVDSKFDSDYSDKKNWTDIKSDSSAVGFYYLIGLENGCRISYSKKQKQVLKYFCCC